MQGLELTNEDRGLSAAIYEKIAEAARPRHKIADALIQSDTTSRLVVRAPCY